MACEDIEKRLKDLYDRKRSLELAVEHMTGHALLAMRERLARLEGQIVAEEADLDDCRKLHQPHTPVPFVGRLKEIECKEAKKEVGADEPYLLIAAVDLKGQTGVGGLPITIPALGIARLGPWAGVKSGSLHRASELKPVAKPPFWDLQGHPKLVAQPQDVIFLVAMMENDGAKPESIRTMIETPLLAKLLANSTLSYDELAAQLRKDMQDLLDALRAAGIGDGHYNFDDRIGAVAHLKLTDDNLQTVAALGLCKISRTFTGEKGQYTVTFSFEA